METKLTPTEGTWEVYRNGVYIKDKSPWKMICTVSKHECGLDWAKKEQLHDPEMEANVELICDAGNTFQKCHLLPSQLLQQRDELMSLLGRCKHFVVVHYCETPSSESELIINEIQKHQI